MEKILPLARQLARARWVPPLVIMLVLAILGGTIFLGTRQLRDSIRRQVVHRDGEILDGVALLEQSGTDSAASLTRQVEDPAGQLALALRLSKLKQEVIAVRLFDALGRFVVSMPAHVRETNLTGEVQSQMERLQPLSRFDPRASLADIFLASRDSETPASSRLPLSSVLIPLHADGQTKLLGTAELIQDGQSLAGELAALDQHLFRQAILTFLIAGGMVGLALGWAFHRLQYLNRRLQEHATSLRRANQELALSAKTSALGAVTAHVVHGLTSPLHGLQQFVAMRGGDDAEWQDALRGTQRMQALLSDIVRVLGEDMGDARYELPLCELTSVLETKMRPIAESAGVRFISECHSRSLLTSRDANLVLLILENLLHNAVQATTGGGTVRLTFTEQLNGTRCTVVDEGTGLPAAVRHDLFAPVRSTKPGGNGIGLALSQHLARHLGAKLELVSSGESGTVFALDLPKRLFVNGHPESVPSEAEPAFSN